MLSLASKQSCRNWKAKLKACCLYWDHPRSIYRLVFQFDLSLSFKSKLKMKLVNLIFATAWACKENMQIDSRTFGGADHYESMIAEIDEIIDAGGAPSAVRERIVTAAKKYYGFHTKAKCVDYADFCADCTKEFCGMRKRRNFSFDFTNLIFHQCRAKCPKTCGRC